MSVPGDGPGTAQSLRAALRLAGIAEADVAIGATPADAVLRCGGVTLWRYRPRAAARAVPPLLIVHGLVGRASVTDLAPDRSLVRDLLEAGIAVFTIHWGSPSRADRFLGFEDYLEDPLDRCVAHVAAEAGRAPVLLGICEGGLFSLCYAALEPRRVAGLVLAVTPVDPHAAPGAAITRWVRSFSTAELGRLIDSLGGLPGPALGEAFQAMTPGRTMAKYTTGLAALADDPTGLRAFLQMERWLADRPDHPAAAARQLLIEHYHENRLARGVWSLGGRRVDLGALRLPVFSAYGLHDHLVPPAQAQAIRRLAPLARHEDCALDAGHIGIFVSRRARGVLGTRLAAWLGGLPDA